MINNDAVFVKLKEEIDQIFAELSMDNPRYCRGVSWLKELVLIAVRDPDTWDDEYLEYIGKRENITRERVRQILHKAAWDNWSKDSKAVLENHFESPVQIKFEYDKPNHIEFITLISSELCKKYKCCGEHNTVSPSDVALAYSEMDNDEIYECGCDLLNDGDVDNAVKCFRLAAESGNRDAIYRLGHMYYYGEKVERDLKQAYYWFDKDGFRELPYYICADMYFYVDQDYENAFKLYNTSLEKDGYENAAYKIGEMYYHGLGVVQSYDRALNYLKFFSDESVFDEDFVEFAAEEAPATANYILSEMYKNGWGVDKNLDLADKLFNAAEKSEWR